MLPRYLLNFTLKELQKYNADFLIIGSGITGMYTALNLARHGHVLLLSKIKLLGGSSLYAQGGIAAALGEQDSPVYHLQDTVRAGAGMCNKKAVEILVREGPYHVKQLMKLGVPFDLKNGRLSFTTEGAHSRPRVLHAGGDATGREICRVLAHHISISSNIRIMENSLAVDLLTMDERCIGALVLDNSCNMLAVYARGIILATGGVGQIYNTTTNPDEATGDGIAMALRAGAAVKDMEFIQFHPTTLNHPQFTGYLISEAVRGEGAVLRNIHGDRFMKNYHPLAELAPRDVVSRGIYKEIHRANNQVFLDATSFSEAYFKDRFPSIYDNLKSIGIDPSKEWIPVAPAAHYLMGGISTDTLGRSSIKGLYACGETACTGVNGANRLASNSLLEGLVFGFRAAGAAAADELPPINEPGLEHPKSKEVEITEEMSKVYDKRLRSLMEDHVGIIRNTRGLKRVIEELENMLYLAPVKSRNRHCLELLNKIHTAYAIVKSAFARQESRGAHFRTDARESHIVGEVVQ